MLSISLFLEGMQKIAFFLWILDFKKKKKKMFCFCFVFYCDNRAGVRPDLVPAAVLLPEAVVRGQLPLLPHWRREVSPALYTTALHCTLYITALHCTLYITARHCTLYITTLQCISLHYNLYHCTTLHLASRHCIVNHWTVLYVAQYTLLRCTVYIISASQQLVVKSHL